LTKFQFNLHRVLEFRRLRAGVARAALDQLQIERQQLFAQARSLAAMRAVEEQTVRLPGATLTTTSLAALDQLQSYVKVAQQRLAQGHARLEQRIARQQAQVVEADRQVGLVEKLESRKLAEWQGSLNKELDELAADSYMARMHRQRKLNDG
jgi:hypothetical protein